MKIDMRRKSITRCSCCLSFFASFLWGCGQNTVTETDSAAGMKPIGEPPVSMKEVTQENYDGTITFRLKVPKDWMCAKYRWRSQCYV